MLRNILPTFGLVSHCIGLLMIVGLFVGCNDDNDSEQEELQGWVTAGSYAISAADIEIYNLDGKAVYGGDEPVTDDFGFFAITIDNLPEDFRIVTCDGYYGEQLFPGDLSADYQSFVPETDVVYVNAVTTIVSRYLDKYPGTTLDEATARVMNFLEIPEGIDIRSGLSATGEDFDHEKFMEEAANNGGVNPFIDQLIAEMDGVGVTHPMRNEYDSMLNPPDNLMDQPAVPANLGSDNSRLCEFITMCYTDVFESPDFNSRITGRLDPLTAEAFRCTPDEAGGFLWFYIPDFGWVNSMCLRDFDL